MLQNREEDMTPFDMERPPMKQKWYLLPLIWGVSFFMTRAFGLRIQKLNMKGFKPPYLVIATHQGFSDYYMAPLSLFPHRANYVSDMEGFAAFGDWLYRAVGCIGKRRFVPDYTVVKNIYQGLQQKQIVVIYPESRHSNVGTTAYLPKNLGKLVKMMGVPLVILSAHGSYLANPFWDEEFTRKVPMEAMLKGVMTAAEVSCASAGEIQKKIEQELKYDEYAWISKQQAHTKHMSRTQGLQKVLYQCRQCQSSFHMMTQDAELCCDICNSKWQLDDHGLLHHDKEKISIPDWYEWERKNTITEIETGKYSCDHIVQVEALPNEKGFICLGEGKLRQEKEGFWLEILNQQLFFSHKIAESVQTEYNYRNKGPCIVLSTRDCCYYIYSKEKDFNPTRIQFAGEYYHQLTTVKKGKGTIS